MSTRASKRTTSEAAEKVARAKKALRTMSAEKKIELMVKAKVLTLKQAAAARKALVKPYTAPGVSINVEYRAASTSKTAKTKRSSDGGAHGH